MSNEERRLLFPDQQAACTGVQHSIEQRRFGSAPSLSKSLTISKCPWNEAQNKGV